LKKIFNTLAGFIFMAILGAIAGVVGIVLKTIYNYYFK